MQPIMTNMAALAVATLYYLWRAHYQTQMQRHRLLCKRVAFLLWTVAERIKGSDSGLSAVCRG
ncbi:MAG TPA: hypothetical protein VMF69_06115 [Gemmataceae bacterium]|nr:hypothetical protein [Gemmataceae bacterium]